jgi:hypothetical protein
MRRRPSPCRVYPGFPVTAERSPPLRSLAFSGADDRALMKPPPPRPGTYSHQPRHPSPSYRKALSSSLSPDLHDFSPSIACATTRLARTAARPTLAATYAKPVASPDRLRWYLKGPWRTSDVSTPFPSRRCPAVGVHLITSSCPHLTITLADFVQQLNNCKPLPCRPHCPHT